MILKGLFNDVLKDHGFNKEIVRCKNVLITTDDVVG